MKTNIFKLIDNVKIINKLVLNKDSVYYILKNITPDMINILKKLKSLNNYLIYEPLDIDWKEKNCELYLNKMKNKINLFNHIICNNFYISNKYKEISPNLSYSVIYHEYDMRFNVGDDIIPQNKIYYIGSLIKSSLTQIICEKYNINIIEPNTLFKENYIGIHIDYITKDKTYYYLHTATKLSTALCLNSIFICNKVPVYVELLGEDYEYYINNDLSNISEVINKAMYAIDNIQEYYNYIKKIKPVKLKLSYYNVINNYKDVLLPVSVNNGNKTSL
jgi:hypothetical protein